nr:RES family NAD+ phosphorylase [Pedobacter cryoconitis]
MIRRTGVTAKCKYCKGKRKSYNLEQMADRVEHAFELHFDRTAAEPSEEQYRAQFSDPESTYHWEREGENLPFLLEDIGGVPYDAAQDVQEILNQRYFDKDTDFIEQEYSQDALYELKEISDDHWQKDWAEFEQIIKTRSRFFSKKAFSYLARVFEGIEKFRARLGRPLVCIAGPEEELKDLYRSRVFQNEMDMLSALEHPDQQIGTPNSCNARSGRMNASGIAVFYGATSPGLAMAEVRPPVGSWIVVGRFDLLHPLRLLDLTALRSVRAEGSIFDPDYLSTREKVTFLRWLAWQCAQPVLPIHENSNYLTTQVIAEFLAEAIEPAFDGIIYNSTQSGKKGSNVVLFHHAARIAQIELPESYRIETTSRIYEPADEKEYVSYHVIVHDLGQPEEKSAILDSISAAYYGYNPIPAYDTSVDIRESSLQIDADNLNIFRLVNAEFETKPFIYKRSGTNLKTRRRWLDGLIDE